MTGSNLSAQFHFLFDVRLMGGEKLLLRSAFENILIPEEMKIIACGKEDDDEDNLC